MKHGVSSRTSVSCLIVWLLVFAHWVAPPVPAQAQAVTTVSAASFAPGPVAAESIVSTFGSGLATAQMAASQVPLPADLGGVKVRIVDAAGTEGFAGLFFVSPTQLNWLIPAWVSPGLARVDVFTSSGGVVSGEVMIAVVAPALFTADSSGSGAPAATALLVHADDSRTAPPVFQCTSAQCLPTPISWSSSGQTLVISLFGTGIRGLSTITAHIGGEEVPVLAAQAQGGFLGLDQVNIRIPFELRTRGAVGLTLTVDGVVSNTVTLFLMDLSISCLDRGGPLVTAEGLNPTFGNANRYLIFNIPDHTVVDATAAEWRTRLSFPVDFIGVDSGLGNTCFSGGRVFGEFIPEQMTHDDYHSTSAYAARVANFLMEDVYAENYGDGIRLANKEDNNTCKLTHASSDFILRRVYFKDMHDDCVENDWGNSGLVEDSLFEGCFTGFSTRPGGACARQIDATNNVFTIRDSLIWMKPTTFSDFPLGNGELFKDDENGPQWALHNNIIRADQEGLFDEGNEVGYGMRNIDSQPGDPNSKLMSCSNNIFVWLGPGDLPPPYTSKERWPLQWLKDPNTGEPCFTFTKDISVWENAVADWKASHGY